MDRRESLGMIGGGMLAASALAPLAVAPLAGAEAATKTGSGAALKLDPANPADVALVYRKLAWTMDDTFGIWWLRGRRYAAIPPTYTPLWDMLIGTMFTVHETDAQNYVVNAITTTFYTDITTGALLETFHNPITGKDAKVPYMTPKMRQQKYGPKGEIDAMNIPGMTMTRNSEPGPFSIEGDDIWLRSDVAGRAIPADETRRPFQVEDLSSYFGSVKDVTNPKLAAIPAGQVFTDLLNYPGWLEMGDRNGHFFSRCFGRKVFSTAAMPARWQELMKEKYPAILADPKGALKG